MIREGPVGSAGAGNASGWMQETVFTVFGTLQKTSQAHYRSKMPAIARQSCITYISIITCIHALDYCK